MKKYTLTIYKTMMKNGLKIGILVGRAERIGIYGYKETL